MLALIFRGVAHYTTGFAFARALDSLNVPYVCVDNNKVWSGEVNLANFDTALCIDDGFNLKPRVMPNMPARSVYYAIDLHTYPEDYIPYLHQFGKIYCAQYTYGVKTLEAAGIASGYLPLAWDNLDITYQPSFDRDISVSFVASRTTERRWYLATIVESKYNGFADTVFHQDLGQILSRSKVGLNDFGGVGENSNERDINLRVFETMGCGALLLQREFPFPDTERIGLIPAQGWFRDVNRTTGEHFWNREALRGDENYVSWKSSSQLFETLRYYLSPEGEQERQEIAERGRQWAQSNRYIDRACVILDELGVEYNRG